MAAEFEHGLQAYRKRRCKCEVCREANAQYVRDNRAARRGLSEQPQPPSFDESEASVIVLPKPTVVVDPEPGPTEQGVIDRCTTGDLVAAARRMPDLAASCRALARIMDDPRQVITMPSAHRQLMAGVAKLETSAASSRRGRLVSVAQMSRRVPASDVGCRMSDVG
jgi:hypothetical protein